MSAVSGPPKDPVASRSRRPPLERLLFRRRFYLQLARIVLGGRRGGTFVSLMGGLGDLITAFPSIETLAARGPLDMGTGAPPYRTLVEANPHVRRVYAPFVYKPARAAHRRLIARVLRGVYDRVVLLDGADARWWERGRHLVATYAEACGVPAPPHGAVYLRPEDHDAAATRLRTLGIGEFVYVVQLVRRRRRFRSWPLAHYHALYAALRERTALPIVVDTTGSDETALPSFCVPLGRLPILPACAAVARAALFIGPDTGLTHAAGALGVRTVAIHVGFPAESCAALGPQVEVVAQREPFADPALTTPAEVLAAVDRLL